MLLYYSGKHWRSSFVKEAELTNVYVYRQAPFGATVLEHDKRDCMPQEITIACDIAESLHA